MRAEFLGALRISRHSVRWTSDEWDELARRVHRARGRHPDESLAKLATRVQKDTNQPWAADRLREFKGQGSLKPLVGRLRAIDLEIRETIDVLLPRLQQTIDDLRKQPSREQLIEAMSDEEVRTKFERRVLDQITAADLLRRFSIDDLFSVFSLPEIAAYVHRETFAKIVALQTQLDAHLSTHTTAVTPVANGQHVKANRQVRVLVVGLLKPQQQTVIAQLGDRVNLQFTDKHNSAVSRGSIASGADYCVLMKNFCPGMQIDDARRVYAHDHVIVHRGGVTGLIDRIGQIPGIRPVAKSRPR